MKLTKQTLKQIIKEELNNMLNEEKFDGSLKIKSDHLMDYKFSNGKSGSIEGRQAAIIAAEGFLNAVSSFFTDGNGRALNDAAMNLGNVLHKDLGLPAREIGEALLGGSIAVDHFEIGQWRGGRFKPSESTMTK